MSTVVNASPIPVTLEKLNGKYTFIRDGEPYFVNGVGGRSNLELLANCGGNSIRTWSGQGARDVIDEAGSLGLTVCAGLWLEHERHGFDYSDQAALDAQFEEFSEHILALKDHPALLMWGIGNEVELEYTNTAVWDQIERIARYIKQVDPHHPIMTVTAFVDAEVTHEIMKRCPSIDILGVNAYGALPAVDQAVVDAKWEKPYIITEWGVDGSWEVDKTSWGAELELTSSQKAEVRRSRYDHIQAEGSGCLGSYAFFWGWKQETTSTWFNLFLKSGELVEDLDTVQMLWSGKYPETRAPSLSSLRIDGKEASESLKLTPNQEVEAKYSVTRGDPVYLRAEWVVFQESGDKRKGGDKEEEPRSIEIEFNSRRLEKACFSAPEEEGAYRLYLFLHGPENKVATANFPFWVGE